MLRISIPLLLLLLFTWVPSGLAAPVTLREAIESAAQQRPLTKAARADAEAAQAAADAAGSRMLPRLGLQENFLITDEPASSLFISLNQEDLTLHTTADPYNHPPTRHDFETRLTLDQPLFDPDIRYGRRRARQGARAADARARWSTEEAAFAAFRSYLRLQQSEAALAWAQSSRQQAAEIERLARERYQNGVGLKADHLRARVALSEAKRRVLSAENDRYLARRSLALAMGRPEGEPTIAAPVTEDLFAGKSPDAAMAARADLSALQHDVRQSEEAVAQGKAAYWPKLHLSASYSLHDEDVPLGTDAGSWRLWSGLSWDLFDGGSRHHNLVAARAEERAAEARLEETANQAAFQLEQARLRAEEARLRLETARISVGEAEESLSLVQQRFENGLAPLSDLLGVRAALDRARWDRLQAETELLETLGRRAFEQGVFLKTLSPQEEDRP